jgi:hypothetical protein
MTIIGRRFALVLAACLVFGACDQDPAGLADVPSLVVEDGMRFQASANKGTHPNEVSVQIEVLNTRNAPRDLMWGGCGVEVRLYKSGSLLYDSRLVDPCDDIGYTAVAHPSQVEVLAESILMNRSQVSAGRYDVVVVFTGRIDRAPVAIEVRAGSIDL